MIGKYLSAATDRIEGAVNDRGQVGIGTLIVFIAMVLVAAIAAGVLINTAGFLQTKSEQTGQESSAQVSNRVQVVSGFGHVANEEVDYINLTVMRGSGSDDINLSTATIEWIGPNRATTLTEANTDTKEGYAVQQPGDKGGSITDSDLGSYDYFNVSAIKDPDDSVPVLDEQDDRFKIAMNTTAIANSRLSEGQEVELKLTTQYGAVTIYRANVPQSLSQENAVTV
ncbi:MULTISPECIES: archaellin/type IV pilin N-terminal domain-containing protein [Halorussus]|uniref:archaellin/type IV pilin N-terminal domain-containing protein n=1 Tax=Halorussus TaxID=1070314 RepID=UPI000E218F41|nr:MULTISPECIES: archaellin/type IV pilin N-terminal domain-containing protein [Halorussus]NHN58917.1 flagellin [Halorussus sp. JP-T4]